MHAPQSERRSECGLRLVMLTADRSHKVDGIHEYTQHLVTSLRTRSDIEIVCENPRRTAPARWCSTSRSDGRSPAVLLQYNPFNFGRWGFAPWLPAKLWWLRRSKRSPKLAVMVHEKYVPITDWRSALMGGWQRLQFFAIRAMADVVFTSISAWANDLSVRSPRRPVHHLPVGSNLPDMRHDRAAARRSLALTDDTMVLAAFGTGHPSRMMDHVAHAAASMAARGIPTVVLNLGCGTPPVAAGDAVRVLTPGHLGEEDVARHLAAADIYLAPFVDGVSTRRTTLMAALQHGLPVVGTDGCHTDALLRRADALRLTPVGDRDAFARAVCELAADPVARARQQSSARALYESEFDWAVVSSRLLAGLAQEESTVRAVTVSLGTRTA